VKPSLLVTCSLIADCYAVNPQTRESTGSLFQFVALASSTATTTATVTVAPMYSASHALATMTALPGNSKAVVFVGARLLASTLKTWCTAKTPSLLQPPTCCCHKVLIWLLAQSITVSACALFVSTTSTTTVCLAVSTFCMATAQSVHRWVAAFGAKLKRGFGPLSLFNFFKGNLSWHYLMAQAVTKLVTAI